jgi:xylan 1,4-beta-xylosidase
MFIGQKTYQADYTVRSRIRTTRGNAEAGLAAIGDDENMIGVSVLNNTVQVWKLEKGEHIIISERTFKRKDQVVLEMKVSNGKDISFGFSVDGKTFTSLIQTPVDGAYLPPWDRAIRAGLISKGQKDQKAVFENFILYH